MIQRGLALQDEAVALDPDVRSAGESGAQRLEEARADFLQFLNLACERRVEALGQVLDLRVLLLVFGFGGVERFLNALELAAQGGELRVQRRDLRFLVFGEGLFGFQFLGGGGDRRLAGGERGGGGRDQRVLVGDGRFERQHLRRELVLLRLRQSELLGELIDAGGQARELRILGRELFLDDVSFDPR